MLFEAVTSKHHVTLVSSDSKTAQAVQAYLTDAGVRVMRSATIQVDNLQLLDTLAVVIFVQTSATVDWLARALALNTQRPTLPLLFVAAEPEQRTIWRAFRAVALPPIVLRESVPAATVHDAIRMACDISMAERMVQQTGAPTPRESLGDSTTLARALATSGVAEDRDFDRFLPAPLRFASQRFWSPLDVIRRAAEWFNELGITSVVDIGSGAGKFCIAGALASRCNFVGIEHRSELVTVARNLSRFFGVDERVTIVHGHFGEAEVPRADCYYLFNPFEENLLTRGVIDSEVELSADRFQRDLGAFLAHVAALPLGTYVLVYHGIGGQLPRCLDQVRVDRKLPAPLRLLRKVRREG